MTSSAQSSSKTLLWYLVLCYEWQTLLCLENLWKGGIRKCTVNNRAASRPNYSIALQIFSLSKIWLSTVSKCSLDLCYSFFVQPWHYQKYSRSRAYMGILIQKFCSSSNKEHQNKWEVFQVYVAFSEKLDFMFEDSLILFQVFAFMILNLSQEWFLLHFNFHCIMTLFICSVGFFPDPSFHGLLETIIKFEF